MDYAAIITACGASITAIGGIIVSITVLLPILRVGRDTHKIVNQQHTDSLNYQNALIRALKDKGIDVPIDQSQPNGEAQDAGPGH